MESTWITPTFEIVSIHSECTAYSGVEEPAV